MFETLYSRPHLLTRHRKSPYAELRARFLEHCASEGSPHSSLRKIAWVLLAISPSLNLSGSSGITPQAIEEAVDRRIRFCRRPNGASDSRSSRLLFIHIATTWVRFLGRLESPPSIPLPFARYLNEFIHCLREARGLSSVTLGNYRDAVAHFLSTVWHPTMSLSALTIQQVDSYLAAQGNRGWSRASLQTLAGALRCFFRYAEGQGWVKGIAGAIESPRRYAQEDVPLGPIWGDVQRLIASVCGNDAADIRARAIVLLLAVYGLRRGEAARLHLEDVDWQEEMLTVHRPKQRSLQRYPLVTVVGEAILRYLKEVRPCTTQRTLFLSLLSPWRALHPGVVSYIVRSHLTNLGIEVPRRGAHCLRHACARHLLSQGFSLKKIGDHLGHRSASATRIYAKVTEVL